MKKIFLVIVILTFSFSFSQTIESTQKGYYKAVVGDSILTNRTTERKAKDDGQNYALKHGYLGYRILFPDYVQVYLTDFKKDTVIVEPPPVIPPVIPPTPIDTTTIGNLFIYNSGNIVQGVVSDEVAKQNTLNFEQLCLDVKSQGYNGLFLNEFDAYFKTDDASMHVALAAVNIPSDFTLKMTDNTHIRVQPNNYRNTTLLSLYKVSNVVIDGGNIHGDRDEHDYSLGGTQEWGHCLRITAGVNVIVKNVTIMDAGGDAIDICAAVHAFADNYVPSSNILITNNILLRSRRNNISITDGRDVLIENNQIIDAGIDTALSSGVLPGWGIDIEAVRNSGKIYEIAEDIIIRNNVETGSKYGSFLIHTGDKITIESNTAENRISYTNTTQSIIRNNIITANPNSPNQTVFGMNASTHRDFSAGYENVISGNTITGFELGMSISDSGLEIFDNHIINCKEGVRFAKVRNCNFYGNTIKSAVNNSNGIVNHVLEYIDNLVIGSNLAEDGNIIDVLSNPIKLYKINEAPELKDYKITIKNNSILRGNNVILINVNNVDVLDNDINAGIWLNTASNINISNNNINGFRLESSLENIFIDNNTLQTCITTPSDAVNFTQSNNTCN